MRCFAQTVIGLILVTDVSAMVSTETGGYVVT